VSLHILFAEDPGISLAQPRHMLSPQSFFGSLQFPNAPKKDASIIY